ncbi:hypothetical protein BJ322DRAFT_1021990 [Thelephora terrestris]|uniref:Uncharacterized protein n=1 Tax=Thelephora terrestris TaxID=56493 RepID=A0A9P6HDA2_9AGAM|nr:hypothetical protein BJ322DRAFT_1021986 [Thelephora terrestris]KAF9783288.1 hypothetical protein BJ322DRAFT_1021990 [Thelephora terrestris]
MPVLRKRPVGPTSRGTIEAYHYQQLRHRKKIVRLNTIVPAVETLSNPRYVNVEELFDTPRRSVKIHDCRVVVGADMYLVTGYWYRYCDINRSVKTSTGLTWRGELTVIKTGRFIPYLKRVSRPYQADIAAAKFIRKHKLFSGTRKRFPTMITS